MRGRVDMHAKAGRLGHGSDERAGATLAVGARDMDHRRQARVRMSQAGEQAAQTTEAEVDQPRMQSLEAGGDLVDRVRHAAAWVSFTQSRPMMRARVAFRSGRFTTMSMMPCSSRYSARWNP